jgi:hypothetical protein
VNWFRLAKPYTFSTKILHVGLHPLVSGLNVAELFVFRKEKKKKIKIKNKNKKKKKKFFSANHHMGNFKVTATICTSVTKKIKKKIKKKYHLE